MTAVVVVLALVAHVTWPGSATAAAAQAAPAQSPQGPATRTAPSGDARVAEAARALSAGDHEAALRLAARHLKADPGSVAARLVIARVHIARDDYERAYEELRSAQRTEPGHVDVLYHLGLVAGRLAVAELERLARIAPDSARMHQVVAESLEAQGKQHEAALAFEEALARQPDLFDALIGLARLRRTALRCEEAIALYERAERVRATYDGAYGLGVCLQYEQDDEQALAQFQTAIRRNPQSALAWQGLGISQMKLGRTEEAIAHLLKAIELQPTMDEAYYTLGQAYRRAGDLERAKVAFDRAQQLQQDGGAPATPQTPR